MQKVVGSSPISRFQTPRKFGGFDCYCPWPSSGVGQFRLATVITALNAAGRSAATDDPRRFTHGPNTAKSTIWDVVGTGADSVQRATDRGAC